MVKGYMKMIMMYRIYMMILTLYCGTTHTHTHTILVNAWIVRIAASQP